MIGRRIRGEGEEEVHFWVVRALEVLSPLIGGVDAANLSFPQRLEASGAGVC